MPGTATMHPSNSTLQALQQRIKQLSPQIMVQYVVVFFGVIGATLALFALKPYIGDTKLSLIYLFIILICAAVAHPSVTFFCGLLSFLCYDFFLVPPYFDFRFELPSLALDPLAFLVVAIVTGVIAERARQHASEKTAYQRADQLRATMLNLVSHNLHTPLSTVKTVLTTLLTKDNMDSDSKQLLLYANLEVDHLNRLVENVLQLSRLEAKTVRIARHWDALDELVTTVLARWPDAVADGSLQADLTGTPFLVMFDFELIEAVLTNLIDNAFRHGRPPVRVFVANHDQDQHEVWVGVQDCGPGVPAPERAQLFQKFVHVKARGIGLGLAVCKGLIEAHGGRMWAEFEAGSSRFIFSLPLTAYVEPED